jgi:hypothetical protein
MKTTFYLLLLISLPFAGCREDEPPAQDDRPEMLSGKVSKNWKITEVTKNGTSIFSSYQECESDNVYTYYADKKYTLAEGNTKCDSTDPDLIFQGSWHINTETNTIIIVNGGSQQYYIIRSLNETTLVLAVNAGLSSYEFTYTMQ